MKISNLIEIQKLIIKSNLENVKTAIDATLGNGKDTITIRETFGKKVKIYAFDIQKDAIERSKRNIPVEYHENIEFIQDSHEFIDKYVEEKVQLVMFNLGYLPKSDHVVKTHPYTTLHALERALEMLDVCGLISIMFYVGHDNAREYNSLLEYIRILDAKKYKAIHINPINQYEYAPKMAIIQKLED